MANPFANESTAIRVGPVESVLKSNLSSTLALESKRNLIRKEFNNPNLTNEEVDRIIYLRENPEMPPSIGPAITHRDAYGRPLSLKLVEQRNKEHLEKVLETVNRNNGLRTFGYSNLSDKQAELNPKLVSLLEKDAAADITAKGLTMAAFIPGMQWLRGVSAPLYYGVNAGLTGASAYDWYKNGPNFWNVTGTIGGGFDLFLPTALRGYLNYLLSKAFNEALNTPSAVSANALLIEPKIRYRLGDVEINDPNLNYRLGSYGMTNDFLQSGLVRVAYPHAENHRMVGTLNIGKSFSNPMFKLGGLWSDGWIISKPGENPNYTNLLVTRQPLLFATKNARPAKRDIGGRRIPFDEDLLNLSNTSAFIWDPAYGFRRVTKVIPRLRFPFNERPSTLTLSERAGIPKGERNLPFNPSVQNSFNVLVSEIPVGFLRVSSRVGPASLLHEEPKSLPLQNEYITNLKLYIQTLLEGQAVDLLTINDYRLYLVNMGIGSKLLTDLEISKLLSNLFSELTKNQTGALKGTILYHGSPTLFDMFDYANSGRYTLNAGAVGPGNYFSTGRNSYGIINLGGLKSGNMQPYLITDVSSTPNSSLLMLKGLIPEYKSPPINLRLVYELLYRIRTTKDSKVREKLLNLLNELLNTPEYLEYYLNNIQNWIDNWKLDKNAFILDENRAPLQTLDVIGRNPNSFTQSLEGMIHRNTGIKSLFPHPSTLQQNPDGTWIISRNWSDPRVNFKLGGKLNYEKD